MFICALRWYREFIHQVENQSPDANCRLSDDGVHASVGYCLYSLGLFEEAIAWSKSCMGPDPLTDVVCRALVGYEAQLTGGTLLATERSCGRTRYTVVAPVNATQAQEATARLKAALKARAPTQDFYFAWVSHDAPRPEITTEGYPFRFESDAGDLPRHKMNLIFAICGQADALVKTGYAFEAKRLLHEAALLEPEADFVWDRIKVLS